MLMFRACVVVRPVHPSIFTERRHLGTDVLCMSVSVNLFFLETEQFIGLTHNTGSEQDIIIG